MKLFQKSLIVTALALISFQIKAIDAYFDYKVFHVPGQGVMLETYLNFFSESLHFDQVEGGEQAVVDITIILSQGDEIVTFSKKSLQSSVIADSIYSDMMDQQRFLLDYGVYMIEVVVGQPAFQGQSETFTEEIAIERPELEIFFSDVQWVAAFKKTEEPNELTKSGYDLLPYVSNYMPTEMNSIVFYAELYGADEKLGADEPFLLVYYVENHDTKQKVESIFSRTKMNTNSVIPIMKKIDIRNLRSGNYSLVLEVRDKENNLVSTQAKFFQRANVNIQDNQEVDYTESIGDKAFVTSLNNMDTLYEYINSLIPIAGDGEASLIRRFHSNKNLDNMQRFFYAFWKKRDEFAPERAWNEYRELLSEVEQRYGAPNRKGYETDMGRVYLAYGPPDVFVDRPSEPNAYPYQIWQYFRADRWTNVRFVFYDRTLLMHDYELLHCDKIPGEIKNPRWDMLIHQRDTPLNEIDRTQSRTHFGGRTQDFFLTPR